MGITSKKLAIDLGTSMTRIHVPRKGVVVNEPSIITFDSDALNSNVVAVGARASEMSGKSPDELHIVEPMRAGVIADYRATRELLSRFIHQSSGRFHLSKPEAMLTLSGTATSTEKKALLDASLEAGLQNVHLIQTNVAAALGAGLQITEPTGVMVIDLGAGTTEVGVFSLGGVVAEKAIRTGGNNIDEAIRLMARREHGIHISSDELKRLKFKFLNLKAKENNSVTITGQSIIQGTPKKATIKQKVLQGYLEPPLESIVRSIKSTLEQTPPDVVSDIAKHGVTMTGGSAKIKGLGHYFSKQLHVAFIKSQHPSLACIKGAHLALTHLEDYRKSLLA